jgi:hypothetical protein
LEHPSAANFLVQPRRLLSSFRSQSHWLPLQGIHWLPFLSAGFASQMIAPIWVGLGRVAVAAGLQSPWATRGCRGGGGGGWAGRGRRRRARPVGGEPPARTSQLGGRFPEGARRQTQVASAARTAVQQVPTDVVSVLVHPPQRTADAGPGRLTHLDVVVTPGGDGSKEGGAVRCTWDTAGTRGLRPRAQLRRSSGCDRPRVPIRPYVPASPPLVRARACHLAGVKDWRGGRSCTTRGLSNSRRGSGVACSCERRRRQ